MFFIYSLMLVCAAGLAVFVYRYDLCTREPWYMVVLAVGLGFTVMWMAGAIEDIVLGRMGPAHVTPGPKAAVVATAETVARIVMVFTVATLFRSRFTDPLDGLMYGTLGGLGMAIEESFLYLSLAPATPQTLAPKSSACSRTRSWAAWWDSRWASGCGPTSSGGRAPRSPSAASR